MAVPLKVTWFFEAGKSGWSETMYYGTGTLQSAMDDAKLLMAFRRAMMGKTSTIVSMIGNDPFISAVRVSDEAISGDSLMATFFPSGTSGLFTATEGADAPFSALLLRLEGGAAHRRQMYLRGIPDDIDVQSGTEVDDAKFRAAFQAWRTKVLSGPWGMKIPTANAPTNVSAVAEGINRGTFAVTTQAAHLLASGDFINIRGKRCSWLRGRYTVLNIIDPMTFQITARHPLGFLLGPANVRKLTPPDFVKFSAIEDVRITHRATGRPFGSPRGRRNPVRI